jgi:hypothetical protein
MNTEFRMMNHEVENQHLIFSVQHSIFISNYLNLCILRLNNEYRIPNDFLDGRLETRDRRPKTEVNQHSIFSADGLIF